MSFDPKVGDMLANDYELRQLLGQGGMGKVFRAWDRRANEDVAIKWPLPERFESDADRRQFVDEADRWMDLGEHHNILKCHHVKRVQKTPFIVAEYVDAGSLHDWIESRRLYAGGTDAALERILDIAIQVANGLAYAHSHGLIHQDVKPHNVLMTAAGIAKVADFGLARPAAAAGSGTVEAKRAGFSQPYASPEQLSGLKQALRRSTDIWSWGASVLEMFAGGVFWQAGPDYALEAYLEGVVREPDLPTMPQEIVTLLRECLEPKERDRPRSFTEVIPRLATIYRSYRGREYPRALLESGGGALAQPKASQPEAPRAVTLRERAAEGAADAQYELGQMLRSGRDGNQDYEEAFVWLVKAANQGHIEAQYTVGVMFDQGEGRRRDWTEAAKWYRCAADAGHPDAQYGLAWMLEKGKGINQDFPAALEYYRRAAEQGQIDAQGSLGMLYRRGRGVTRDLAESLKWYRKAAEQGDPVAQVEVGLMYSAGEGTPRNYGEAARWFYKAAEKQQVVAMYSIGVMFANGYGLPVNQNEAVRWFRRAAELSHVDAMYRLWIHYSTGAGVEMDARKAWDWLNMAASRGSRDAQNQLASNYEAGAGVLADAVEAALWYEKAAEQDHPAAKYNLARLYVDGKGVKRDVARARALLQSAAADGIEEAESLLAQLAAARDEPTAEKKKVLYDTAPEQKQEHVRPEERERHRGLKWAWDPEQSAERAAPPPGARHLKWENEAPSPGQQRPEKARSPAAPAEGPRSARSAPTEQTAGKPTGREKLGRAIAEHGPSRIRNAAVIIALVLCSPLLLVALTGETELLLGCSIAVLALVGPLLVYAALVWQRTFVLFENGVAFKSFSEWTALTWQEVAAVSRRWTRVTEPIPQPNYVLDSTSGTSFKVDGRLARSQEIGRQLLEHFLKARIVDFTAALQGGKELRFGAISLDRNRLAVGKGEILLADLDCVRIEGAQLLVQKKNAFVAWRRVSLNSIQNLDVLYTLLGSMGKAAG